MQELEPHYMWRHIYQAETDQHSPFYGKEYSEFYYTHAIYNFYIHPQWDSIGSPTLFIKILFIDYSTNTAIIELIGEWNDAINNDIMLLKRDIIEHLYDCGISNYILIGENILNFHSSDDSYYEEWWQEVDDLDGYIALINFREHVLSEMQSTQLDHYLHFGGPLNDIEWRKLSPYQLTQNIHNYIHRKHIQP